MMKASQKKRSSTKLILSLLIFAGVGATLGCDRGGGAEETEQSAADKNSENTPSEEVTEGLAADAASQRTDAAARHPNDYDMEAEREARIAISRDVFGEEGPITCASVCDCPPGFGCQGGSNRCVPSMISGRCCSWETDCPTGQTCIDENGDSGTCAE